MKSRLPSVNLIFYPLLTSHSLFLIFGLFSICTSFLCFPFFLLPILSVTFIINIQLFPFFIRHVLQAVRHKITVARHVLQAVRHKIAAARHVLQAVRHKIAATRHVLQVVRHKIAAIRHVLQAVRHKIKGVKPPFLELLDTIIGHREANFTFEGGKYRLETMQKA